MTDYTLKKSLGQHFLKDENVTKRIVEELTSIQYRQLLEVGPGAGALTKYLQSIEGIDFKAVELDNEKVIYLEKIYPTLANKIIEASILDIDAPFENNFVVIGNFPYNISSQILFKILDWKNQVTDSIGMFQKEVADRVAAGPGSKTYGILSVLVQAYYDVKYLFDVPPESFNPPPKVMSGVIRLTKRSILPNFKSERSLFVLVKLAFNQRRKTLRNATKSLFSAEVLQDPIFDKRAEQLSVNEFAALTFKMN
ncbi:16S rRNA (adenine(1518)-N(6)/adenine(1519)-N(6))-dimethyltransferase RsmA [Rhizosphaericola mali]|uniref:Ribosomal RNA small subunit methyltransferase A n=1 Tax=Rhizosphaericola mali TaxID=2545455 RepID=A0A5P2G7K6_9BACT|nr:16S rRNA (adenine(1518)-N(6)/adenine(1519)-N(6))-dimethyltransferase RsmA [Rhizosphaericola mali]QES89750.1 ribosomal RNA small subunit methyltransferase A [Rhizosphaericola mali]